MSKRRKKDVLLTLDQIAVRIGRESVRQDLEHQRRVFEWLLKDDVPFKPSTPGEPYCLPIYTERPK